VREDLPDVQWHRPEVSSALAAVLDRATAKDLDRRYADHRELIADLEEVLAIETARSGQVTGEATQVLRTLPPSARRRVPLRLRTSMLAIVGVLALFAGVVVLVLWLVADNTERGTGSGRAVREEPTQTTPTEQLANVNLRQDAGEDYDPLGDGGEHPEEADLVVDRDPNTTWSTETYPDGFANIKDGVGITIDAEPGVAARAMVVDTPTAGFKAAVYGSMDARPTSWPSDDWVRLANTRSISDEGRIPLETAGNRYRYYLLWITELGAGDTSAEISEIYLRAPQNR
jgi:serine/threonine-protein kinase